MELGVIRGAIHPHSVNDFEPTVTESAQSISVTAILLAMILIVTLGPRTTGQTLLSKKTWPAGGVCHKPNVDERDDIFRSVWSPGLFRHSIVDFGHRRRIVRGHRQSRRATAERSWGRRLARNRIDRDQDDERRVLRFVGDRLPIAFQ